MSTKPAGLSDRAQIDVRAIERELNDLWKQATSHEDGEARPVTRVCVLNLIAGVVDSRAADEATEVIAHLMARHPNRAIVVVARPEATPALLDAWVQAHCQMPAPGRPQVCCEQITIEARGEAVARVPGTVLPLLVPDVPVMLWWPRGEPFGNPLFSRLRDLAGRAIIDSATFAAPEAGLAKIAALMNGRRALSDLSWGRLTPWRELIAQFFDAPAMLQHLDAIERVAVGYEARPGKAANRSQALLLVGWLAARLGWSQAGAAAEAGGVTTLSMRRRDGGSVTITLQPAAPHADRPDRVVSLTLACAGWQFHIASESIDRAVTRVEQPGVAPLQRVVRLERLSEADLLAEELRLLGRDYGYEGALRVAAGLLG